MGGNARVFPEWLSSTSANKFPMETDHQVCWGKGREDGKEVFEGLFTRLESWGQRCSTQKLGLKYVLLLKIFFQPA